MKTVLLAFVYALLGFIFGVWALGVLVFGFNALQAVSVSLTLFVLLLVVFIIASLVVGAIVIVTFLNRRNMLIPLLVIMSAWILFVLAGFVNAMLGGSALFDIPALFGSLFLV